MITHILKDAFTIKPIKKIKEIDNHDNLSRLFFSHSGRKYCETNKFPPLHLFKHKEKEIEKHGFFVDAGEIIVANDPHVGLIGSTTGILFFTDNTKVYKIILMHGAKAKILASNYTVLLIANIDGCEVEIHKDHTVLVL